MPKVIAIVSGGLDSSVLAYWLKAQGYALSLLSFDYGQRHKKELYYARVLAQYLGVVHEVVDLSVLKHLLRGSALTDTIAVPNGHYADPNMAVTIVPNRNAILLSVAYAVAVSQKADTVALGVHSGDHPVYPDCRPEFVRIFEEMERVATGAKIDLCAPFIDKTKAEIVAIGNELGVDFSKTWSCYKGGECHCGVCGTCVERKEAFVLAGVNDPTEYR